MDTLSMAYATSKTLPSLLLHDLGTGCGYPVSCFLFWLVWYIRSGSPR